MQYKTSFRSIIDKNGFEIINNNFMFHCLLSDRVGGDLVSKQYIDAFFEINSDPLYGLIKDLNYLEAKELVKSKMNTERYPVETYIRAVEPLFLALFPKEYKEYKSKNANKRIKAIAEKECVKPQRQKRIKSISVSNIEKVTISSCAYSLNIDYSNDSKFHLIDCDTNKDVTKQLNWKTIDKMLFVDIHMNGKYLVLQIPRKRYSYINLIYSGRFLSFLFKEKNLTKIKVADFAINNAIITMSINAEKVNVTQNDGYNFICGTINDLTINQEHGEDDVFLYPATPGKCTINNEHGTIKLSFVGNKIKPRINKFFHRPKEIKGKYNVGDKKIDLIICTETGKIIVK